MTVYLKNIGDTPYILSGAAPLEPGDRLELTPELCGVNSATDPVSFGSRVVASANANLPAPRLELHVEADADAAESIVAALYAGLVDAPDPTHDADPTTEDSDEPSQEASDEEPSTSNSSDAAGASHE